MSYGIYHETCMHTCTHKKHVRANYNKLALTIVGVGVAKERPSAPEIGGLHGAVLVRHFPGLREHVRAAVSSSRVGVARPFSARGVHVIPAGDPRGQRPATLEEPRTPRGRRLTYR